MEPFDEMRVRRERLAALENSGVNAYPSRSSRTHTIARLVAEFDDISNREETVTAVGRIMAIRGHGGSTFLSMSDGTVWTAACR